jgi:hypothetical protein
VNKVKYFIIETDIQNREREYGEQLVVADSDAEHAFEKTKRWLLEIYCCDAGEKWEDDQLDLWDQVIEIQWPREIPWKDYAVLQKYLPIVN